MPCCDALITHLTDFGAIGVDLFTGHTLYICDAGIKQKSVQQTWGPVHILQGLDPITVQSPYKDAFIANDRLQVSHAESQSATEAVATELDAFEQKWLRHSVHPAWIHTRFFDDKLKDYIKHVLLPEMAEQSSPQTNPLCKWMDTNLRHKTGTMSSIDYLDHVLNQAKVHFTNPIYMKGHHKDALRGETYWIKTWGSHSVDKFAGKGMAVNDCMLPDFETFQDALSPFAESTTVIPVNSSLWLDQDKIENIMLDISKMPGEYEKYVENPFYNTDSPIIKKYLRRWGHKLNNMTAFTMTKMCFDATWYGTRFSKTRRGYPDTKGWNMPCYDDADPDGE